MSPEEPTVSIPVSKLLADMEKRIDRRLGSLFTELSKISATIEKSDTRVRDNENAITKIKTVGVLLALLVPPATAVTLYLIERAAN